MNKCIYSGMEYNSEAKIWYNHKERKKLLDEFCLLTGCWRKVILSKSKYENLKILEQNIYTLHNEKSWSWGYFPL